MPRFLRDLFVIFLLLCAGAALPARSIIEPGEPLAADAFEYLIDREGSLGPDQVRAALNGGRATGHGGDFIALGFLGPKTDAWFAFRVRNPAATTATWHLSLRYAVLDFVDLYEHGPTGWNVERQGDLLPVSARGQFRDPHFLLELPPGQEREYMVRIRTTSATVFVPGFATTPEFILAEQIETAWICAYLGLMGGLLLYNFFVFFATREVSYLFYTMYVFALWVFQFCNFGIAALMVFPEHPAVPQMAFGVAGGGLIFLILLFTFSFHSVGERFPRLAVAFYIFLGLSALSIPLSLVFGNQFNNGLSFLLSLFVLGTAILSYVRGYRPARYFLLAWVGFVVLVILWSLSIRGIIQSYFAQRFGFAIGSTIEVLLFAMALGDRINVLNREKETALLDQVNLKTRLLDSFARFVPRQFLKSLGKDSPEDVVAGNAAAREVTILFCDIRGFTALSEKMSVDENFRFLNSYLRRMEPLIERQGGFVDKYIGDAIMALFLDHPGNAITCARQMLQELIAYNHHRTLEGYQPINIGIGIHTGQVMLGTVGTEKRMDTTVIGDAVNLASRIESMTKTMRKNILVSEDVYERLNPEEKKRLDRVAEVDVRGKSASIVLFEPGPLTALDFS